MYLHNFSSFTTSWELFKNCFSSLASSHVKHFSINSGTIPISFGKLIKFQQFSHSGQGVELNRCLTMEPKKIEHMKQCSMCGLHTMW